MKELVPNWLHLIIVLVTPLVSRTQSCTRKVLGLFWASVVQFADSVMGQYDQCGIRPLSLPPGIQLIMPGVAIMITVIAISSVTFTGCTGSEAEKLEV